MKHEKEERKVLHVATNPLVLPSWGKDRRGSGISDELTQKTTRNGAEYYSSDKGVAILPGELPKPNILESGWMWECSTNGTLRWAPVS